MPDPHETKRAVRVVVLAPRGEMATLVAEIKRAACVDVERAEGRGSLERACERGLDIAVVVEGTDGLDLRLAQALLCSRGQAPETIVYAAAWDEAAMRAALELGASEFVTAEQRARLGAAVAREARRVRVRLESVHEAWTRSSSLLQAVLDALPSEELRSRIVNQWTATMFHTTKEALLGTLDHEHVPKAQADGSSAMGWEALASREMKVEEEVVVLAGNGDRLIPTHEMAVTDADDNLDVLGVVVEEKWEGLVDHFETDGRRSVFATETWPRGPGIDLLSERERQVVELALLGRDNKEIAYDLGLSHSTVRVLMARSATKLGVRSRDAVLVKARDLSRKPASKRPGVR
jgi:DNA-binding NarL/FixJ family response regulator